MEMEMVNIIISFESLKLFYSLATYEKQAKKCEKYPYFNISIRIFALIYQETSVTDTKLLTPIFKTPRPHRISGQKKEQMPHKIGHRFVKKIFTQHSRNFWFLSIWQLNMGLLASSVKLTLE